MNKKYLLVLFALLTSTIFIEAKYKTYRKFPAGCQCYCSYKCGPRDPNQPGDAPFIDPETGICFCQKRDQEKYFEHGCDKLNNAKGFRSCCKPAYRPRKARTNVRSKPEYYKQSDYYKDNF